MRGKIVGYGLCVLATTIALVVGFIGCGVDYGKCVNSNPKNGDYNSISRSDKESDAKDENAFYLNVKPKEWAGKDHGCDKYNVANSPSFAQNSEKTEIEKSTNLADDADVESARGEPEATGTSGGGGGGGKFGLVHKSWDTNNGYGERCRRRPAEPAPLAEEIKKLKEKVAAMEAREMAPNAHGDSDSLTSLRDNSRIKIGGYVELPIVVENKLIRGVYKIRDLPEVPINEMELWVIERPVVKKNVPATEGGESPQLRAVVGEAEVPMPLQQTSVNGSISGYISTVNVLQKYYNPYSEKIEAVYVFPLPQDAAVTDFVMIVGERKIRGMIREKEEAKRIYADARRQGYRASLLIQHRPNVFRQKVANIEPGKRIDISITYFNTLRYVDGEYEFAFPVVVGPRYNPAGYKDGIGTGGGSQPVDVKYLKPGESAAHRVTLNLDIDAGMKIERVYSHSHAINVRRFGENRAKVSIKESDSVPNKDFVLRYQVAGDTLKSALLVHEAKDGKYFTLMLQPPKEAARISRMPREMVFVLDCSGSMSGKPMAKAKQAMRRCLRNLDPVDTFQVIRFSDNASSLGDKPLKATSENVKRGLKYIESLNSCGGTRMIEGIKVALDFPHEKGRMRIVSFMTDGYIGNEAEILATVHEGLGDSRIFSFGIGSSVNRYLLDRLAFFGKGAVAYVGLDESAGDKVDLFYERVARPALADIHIDWNGMKVSEVYPKRLPDLFVGRPVFITGRFTGNAEGGIKVSGRVGMDDLSFNISVPEERESHQGVRSIWARWRIRELANAEVLCPEPELKDEIRRISLGYNLLSKYTAFLAVDSSQPTVGSHGYSVKVPTAVPDGVRYDTTIGGE